MLNVVEQLQQERSVTAVAVKPQKQETDSASAWALKRLPKNYVLVSIDRRRWRLAIDQEFDAETPPVIKVKLVKN